MDVINHYQLQGGFTNANAGMGRWVFATKGGKEYFLKEFLSPKYPASTTGLSPDLVQRMREEAEQFYKERKRFYDKLAECRTGNVVVVEEFFRSGSNYYIATERMRGSYLRVSEVAALSAEKKRVLLRAISYSMIPIHERHIVHADLKPDNILIKQTSHGYCTGKLIDFDSGFFEGEIPDEIVGDLVYFSPEAVLANAGLETKVSVKSDIFALGLLFHQYWCGEMPEFDHAEYDYASDVLLDGKELRLSPVLPEDIRSLICKMLAKDPEARPSSKEVREMLSGGSAKTPSPPPASGWYVPSANDL